MTRVRRGVVVLASVVAVLAIFAVWADRQLLDEGAWDTTSSELIQNGEVRSQVAGFLVDELVAGLDVEALLEAALPPQAAGLAGPGTIAVREAAERGMNRLLARPHAQELWQRATQRTHAAFVTLVTAEGAAGDDVTLDLHELLTVTQERTGVGGRAAQALPAHAGQITVLQADGLRTARDLVDVLQALVAALCALALALYAGAVLISRSARRETLRACGIGLVAAGSAVLVGRGLAGHAVVDALTSSDAVRPAADATWKIATSLLAEIATAVIGYGIVVVVTAWLAGPTRLAVRARHVLAPYLAEARVAYSAGAVLVLLLLAWDPVPATHHIASMAVLTALVAASVRALRSQTMREA